VRIAWNWQSLYGFRLSREGRTLAVTGSGKTLFYDMPSETMCATYERGWGDIQFLPSEREFFCFDWLSKAHAVFRVGTAEPIAVLPGVGSSGLCPPAVSPDGRWIACAGQGFGTTILKRTGWDCLPSPAGMLVFPPTWLLAITVAGAAWSLRGDARRVGMKHWLQGAPWLRLINACIFTVLVVLTVHALLMVGVRRTPPTTAAPVLLITWIGLGTGSRVWRMAALVTCAAALAWCGWCLRLEWQLGSGWRGTQRVEMLDRAYMWPRALGMGALVAGAVACGIAVVWLALTMAVSDGRRSRSGVCANAGTWQRTDGLE
jgi:hypothetical protein